MVIFTFGEAGHLVRRMDLAGSCGRPEWVDRAECHPTGSAYPTNTGSSVVLSLSHWEGADGFGIRARAKSVLSYGEERPYPEREVRGAEAAA
jgi:hypothetical protein